MFDRSHGSSVRVNELSAYPSAETVIYPPKTNANSVNTAWRGIANCKVACFSMAKAWRLAVWIRQGLTVRQPVRGRLECIQS